MKTLLFPHRFKRVGWVIFPFILIIDIVIMILIHTEVLQNTTGVIHETLNIVNSSSELFTNIAIIGSIICMLFITCSREEVEDEMISNIRLQALLVALYVNSAILIVTSLIFYSLDFLNIMMYNIFTTPLIFMVVYLWKMWILKRGASDEQ
ncbi:MAG: hypothetical protein IKY82_01350 [Alistipes sp.]|nr:hypothetical protein [Alistipes sp.]